MDRRPGRRFAAPRAGRRRLATAVAASLALHLAAALLALPTLPAPVVPPRTPPPPLEIAIVERGALPPLSARRGAEPRRAREGEAARAPSPPPPRGAAPDALQAPGAAATAAAPPDAAAEGGAVDLRGVLERRKREAIAEALSPGGERLVPWAGAAGVPGGPRQPTDSIDGRGRLGSGAPGDPRIPGSGGVDVVAVIERDAVVAQAQEKARQGQVHPFLGEVKDRVETCWLPVAADADAVTRSVAVEDPVCAKGYHLRRTVGRVFAIYDATGARLAFELDTGPDGGAATLLRNLRDRIRRAFEEAGMRSVPPELLTDEGLLRLAWNVYIDDFRGCNQVGRGANAHKPGGDEILGIVELDGVY